MNKLLLFTDVSVNPKKNIGVGAYYLANNSIMELLPEDINKDNILRAIQYFEFEDTSSTKLEVQIAITALKEISKSIKNLETYQVKLITDSQCVAELLDRRKKLEDKDFISSATNLPHQHTELYKEFYQLHDAIKFDVEKIAGHSKTEDKETLDIVFSVIDRSVRAKLRDDY